MQLKQKTKYHLVMKTIAVMMTWVAMINQVLHISCLISIWDHYQKQLVYVYATGYLDAKQNVTGNHLCLMELLSKPLLLHHRTIAGWEFVEHHDQYFLVRTQ